jgi:ectoine hydroxylase-related dioxygenase (phytanoyl-CoA dioxygenase family)
LFSAFAGYNVTAEQIAAYRRDGYISLPIIITAEELRQWREAVDEAVAERPRDWKFPLKGMEDIANGDFDYFDRVFLQRLQLWTTNQRVKDLLVQFAPKIARIVAALEGVSGMRLHHDQALSKAPWANPTSWHVDNPFWNFFSAHAASVRISLDDETRDNGCIYVLPGSHNVIAGRKDPYAPSEIGKNMDQMFEGAHKDLKAHTAVALEHRVGTVSIHNGLLPHAAHANMSPHWRRSFTFAMLPDGSTFSGQQNILTKKAFEKMKVGDVLEDDGLWPLLWHDEKPFPRFPPGLPNLRIQGHDEAPMEARHLSGSQLASARRLGYKLV